MSPFFFLGSHACLAVWESGTCEAEEPRARMEVKRSLPALVNRCPNTRSLLRERENQQAHSAYGSYS